MRTLRGLNRPLALFLWHSAIFHVGALGVADVVLNFYFVSLGYAADAIGLLQGVSRVGGAFLGIPIGILADRIGAKRVIIGATLLAALSYLPMLLMPTLPVLFLSRAIFGVALSAAFIAAAPFLIALVERQHQAHAFGYYQVTTLSMAAFGSLLGGTLPSWLVSTFGLPESAVRPDLPAAQTPFAYGGALLVSALLCLVSLLPLLRLPNVRHARPNVPLPPLRAVPWRSTLLLASPILIFGLSAGLTFPFYNLFFRTRFSLPDDEVGAILSFGWLMMGVVGVTTPWWERRFGRLHGTIITTCIAAIAFLALSFSEAVLFGTLMFVIAASVRNLLVPLYEPLRLEYIDRSLHNLSSAVGSVFWSIGWFLSSSLSGILQRDFNFTLIFGVVAALQLLTALSVALIFRKPPQAEPVAQPVAQAAD
ncbi:MAG: MFS transporter [Anaerolineae bacterium]|nr:MFS transporter [Anaerolineae bacterium]